MRLAAYQPDIPQNLGAMIRLCACLNVPIDIIEPCGFPLSIKGLRRSAMDYADRANITRHDQWGDFLTKNRGRIVLLTTKSHESLWDFNFVHGDTVLVGRESAGVPQEVHDAVSCRVGLPMAQGTRSLNVAMAAAMALGEGLRQTKGWTKLEHSDIKK